VTRFFSTMAHICEATLADFLCIFRGIPPSNPTIRTRLFLPYPPIHPFSLRPPSPPLPIRLLFRRSSVPPFRSGAWSFGGGGKPSRCSAKPSPSTVDDDATACGGAAGVLSALAGALLVPDEADTSTDEWGEEGSEVDIAALAVKVRCIK